jgi:PST family polysaccharide transporter
MTLFRTSVLNGAAVAVRMLTLLILNKILAVTVGPAGYALIGQFQNFVAMLTAIATGAINTGVTKYTAEFSGDEETQRRVWRTAGTIATFATTVAGLVILFNYRHLASWLLNDIRFRGVFVWLAFSLALLVLNALLLAILNGKKEVKTFVVVNMVGSFIGLVLTGALAITWGLYGALVALAVNQAVAVSVTLALCALKPWFRFRYLFGQWDPEIAVKLGKYALMAATSAAVVPVAQIAIRNHLADTLGWDAAGQWQAVAKISELYMALLVGTLSLYYLPRLAEIKQASEMKREILNGYRFVLPIAIIGAGSIYLLRDFITVALFSPSFLPMRGLFFWQVIGDVMKIGSWLLAYVMLGQSLTRAYVLTELGFSALLVALVVGATKYLGLAGVPLAYCLCYFTYWLTVACIVSRHLRTMENHCSPLSNDQGSSPPQ